MFKKVFIKNIGDVTVKLNESSKCKFCKSVIVWGINDKAQSVPLDYINGNYYTHKCKANKYDDRYETFKEQKRREGW